MLPCKAASQLAEAGMVSNLQNLLCITTCLFCKKKGMKYTGAKVPYNWYILTGGKQLSFFYMN